MTLVYVPSHAILLLTFVLSAIFISSLINEGDIKFYTLGNGEGSFFRKITPAIIVALVAIFIIWIIIYTEKIVAIGYFHSGVQALNLPNSTGTDKAEMSFKKALSLDKTDTYYQALSEVDIAKVTDLAKQMQTKAQQSGAAPDQENLKKIGSLIDEAVAYSRSAIAVDSTNYYNYLSEARASEVAVSLQIKNAYENAKNAYASALTYNPYNPSIYLSLARLEVAQNKLADAQKDIGVAIQLKPNYIDAIFLLSQIQVNQGQIKDAITSVQYATKINPNNPLLYFQLGMLYYNDKNYQDAVDSLTQALKFDNKYANAQYFLGLSYVRLNKMADAIAQFESLVATNPDNQEVTLILSNLRKGKSPFNDAPAPIDSKPEKRKSLPIKEKTAVKATAN